MAQHRVFIAALNANPSAKPWVVGLFESFGNGGAAESLNCSTPLVASTNTSVVIGYCCSFVCGDTTFAALQALVAANQIPAGVYYAVCDETGPNEGIINLTNFNPAYVGMRWDLPTAMADTGWQFPPAVGP